MSRYPRKMIVFLTLPAVIPGFLLIPTRNGNADQGNSERMIERLIDHLRSDKFETREAASNTLIEMIEAVPALQKARKSDDLELRLRATNILRELAKKRAQRALCRAKDLAKAGRIVEAVDRVVYWGQLDNSGEGWEIITQFVSELNSRTERCFPPHGFWLNPKESSGNFIRNPIGDFHQYAKSARPREIAARMIDLDSGGEELILDEKTKGVRTLRLNEGPAELLLRSETICWMRERPKAGIHNGIIAASGDVEVPKASNSVIIAGGKRVTIRGFGFSILVCDGDLELAGSPDGGIIIARGKVTCAAGKGIYSLVRSGNVLHLPDGTKIDLKDGTPNPLAFVKFFELSDVGLAAEDLAAREKADGAGVRLKEVRKDSPFVAGLRAGDVISAIEDRKTPTTEVFRRVLRRKLAKGGPTLTFTVRRSGKTLDVPIAVKD